MAVCLRSVHFYCAYIHTGLFLLRWFFCLACMSRNFAKLFRFFLVFVKRWARGLADGSYILINLPASTYAAQSSSPLSWALGSEQEVTLSLLQHSSSDPFPLLALLEGTKPLGDKTVQSDSNRCEKCVVIVSPSWLLLVTVLACHHPPLDAPGREHAPILIPAISHCVKNIRFGKERLCEDR